MSVKRNILKNGLSIGVQNGVKVLDQLLLVPFFITAWGAAYYGEWLTLTIIPSVLAFSDLSLGSSAANSFVLKYASGEKQKAANIAKTGFIVISLAILGGIILGGMGLGLIVEFDLLKNSLISTYDAVWSLSFLIIARFLNFYNQLIESYFRAARKASLGINLLTVNSVLNLGAGLLVLLLGYGVVVFALSQLIITIIFNCFYAFIAFSTLKLHREHKGIFIKSEAKDIFTKGLGYLMSPMWQTVLFQGTTFVVRLTLGPSAVAVFNTVRTLSRSVNQLYSIVNGSVFPEIQYEIGAGRMDKARKIFNHAIKLTFGLSVLGVVFLAIFGLPLYSIWTKNELNPPTAMWYVFLIGILFNAVWWTAGVVFRAMNKPYRLSIAGLAAAVISVICSYVFCGLWGLVGVAVGSLLFEIIMAIYILPVSHKLINSSVKPLKR